MDAHGCTWEADGCIWMHMGIGWAHMIGGWDGYISPPPCSSWRRMDALMSTYGYIWMHMDALMTAMMTIMDAFMDALMDALMATSGAFMPTAQVAHCDG